MNTRTSEPTKNVQTLFRYGVGRFKRNSSLFPDTEPGEDLTEQIITAELAGNLGERVLRLQ